MLAHGNSNGYGILFYDGLIVVDLTVTSESENKPDKEWYDSHIKYFNGTTTIYK